MMHWRSEGTSAKIVPFESVKREASTRSVGDMIDTMGISMKFNRNGEIFGENEPADYVYRIVSGAVRTCKLMSDGRRQIGAFYLPGDLFGLECEEFHDFSAEAIGDCTVRAIKRKTVLAEAASQSRLLNQLWAQTTVHLQRAQQHILLLGRKNAQERIAAFLLDMAERLSRSGDMELPMSRQDIADYLGLTIETVSRTLTQLERDGLIAIPVSRRIVFRNRAALDVMNDSLAA
jgi:CRP/FNR family nitrogen fixation transcriptional regulator